MEAAGQQNSITYDAEKDELKVITYYDERRFKEIWIRGMQIGFLKYMMQTWDLKIRIPGLTRIYVLWGACGLLAMAGTLYYLVSFFTSGLSLVGGIIAVGILIYLWHFVFTVRRFCLENGIKMANSVDFLQQKRLRPTMDAIRRAFEKQPVFRQELTITRDGHTATMPYPDAPLVHSDHSESYIRAFLDENDLFFLQLTPPKAPYPYYPVENIHLVKDDYTPDEWELLVDKLTEMEYL